MQENSTVLWIWLSLVCGAGSKSPEMLLDAFGGSVFGIYEAEEKELCELSFLDRTTRTKLCNKELSEARSIYAFCKNEGVGILTYESALYPQRLKRIRNCPTVLYYKGILRDLEPEVCIAEVGTRDMTEYGASSSYSVAYDLAKAGAIVVSGMAKGVDGMAHRGAIDAGGYTVAVLGNGIDRAYPAEHKPLMEEIIKNGMVITEFKPFTAPQGRNFPIRNRIVSGLCQGTVVMEAPSKSGALITADIALEQGRDVFAFPGKVGELNSSGTNGLIRRGAKIVMSASDILSEYQPLYSSRINLNNIPQVKARRYIPSIDLRVASPSPIRKKNAEESLQNKSPAAKNGKNDTQKVNEPVQVPQRELDLSSFPEDQSRILSVIKEKGQASADELAMITKMSVGDVLASLTLLELTDTVSALPGNKYSLKS